MPREKKEAKTINMNIALPVYEKLEEFCKETGSSKTIAVERILTQFFDAYFRKPEKERSIYELNAGKK